MNIKVGILKSKIDTDNPKLLKALVDLYTFRIPGSEFTPAYRRGRWDGKQRYISTKGTFRSGLLSRIISDLTKIGCKPNIELSFEEPKLEKVQTINSFSYYDFQEKLIKKALTKFRGIIKSPTGSGKTLIIAGIVKALQGRKMVILFNAKQLLTQTYEFLTKTCGIENVGLCFGEGYIYGDIMLCTVQSIDKILDTHLEEAEAILVDEVHEFANGKTTLAAIKSFPKAKFRLGFTATPPSNNIPKYNLEGAFGPTWDVTSTSALVKEGKLTKPIIQLLHTPSTSGRDNLLGYNDVYDQYIINNDSRNDKICEIVNKVLQAESKFPPRILILTKNLDHAEILNNSLEGSYRLWGDDDLPKRYKTISKFLNSNNGTVLIGTKILQTGINIEEITHFINARGLKSEIATLQALGRALRKHDTKQEVYVYDFLDSAKYLRGHSKQRKKHYISEGHEVNII